MSRPEEKTKKDWPEIIQSLGIEGDVKIINLPEEKKSIVWVFTFQILLR